MNHNELLLLTYVSQIVLISIIMPSWAIKRITKMTVEFPPESYPKLYPVSVASMMSSLRTFKYLNAMMAVIGFLIIAVTLIMAADELLNWDTQSMLTLTFFLQVLPFFYLFASGIKYQQIMRQVSQSQLRKATLAPRNMLNFVPMHMLLTMVVTFIGFVATVVYVQQNPFPGFAGYWNILFVFLLNAFYFLMIHKTIISRKIDPHQSHEDRMIFTHLVTKILVLGAIFCNLFLTVSMLLSVLDLRHIGDIIQSLYFQLVALMMSQTTTYEPTDYSVYQGESKNSPLAS